MAFFSDLEAQAKAVKEEAATLSQNSSASDVAALAELVEKLAAILEQTNATLKDKVK